VGIIDTVEHARDCPDDGALMQLDEALKGTHIALFNSEHQADAFDIR
jgi:hypothetical protein